MKLFKTREDMLLELLGRIANALDRAYPVPADNSEREALPPLGITVADNETMVAMEEEEERQAKSKEEKLMKEYKEYIDWRKRNVR